MENDSIIKPRIIVLTVLVLIVGVFGGYFYSTSNLQPTIDELKQNNTELISRINNVQSMYNETQSTLKQKEAELLNAQVEIDSLKKDVDIYAGDIESLQNEVDRITELYQQIEYDYQTLSIEYENLTLQTRYRLNEIFKREDLVLSYNLPDRIYTSPSFTIEGTTSRFEYNLWCDQATSSSSAQIRIYKAGTPIRVYSHSVRLKESSETELYYAEGSFSIVLAEGSYYITLVIDSGSLSPSPIYQSNIQIWDYY